MSKQRCFETIAKEIRKVPGKIYIYNIILHTSLKIVRILYYAGQPFLACIVYSILCLRLYYYYIFIYVYYSLKNTFDVHTHFGDRVVVAQLHSRAKKKKKIQNNKISIGLSSYMLLAAILYTQMNNYITIIYT